MPPAVITRTPAPSTPAPTPPPTPPPTTTVPRDSLVLAGALADTVRAAHERERKREAERLHWKMPEEDNVANCPVGYYRTWLMVFRCRGGSGTAYVLMPPANKKVELQEIPAGTVDLQVRLSAPRGTELIVWDKDSNVDVGRSLGSSVDRAEGTWSGEYRGMRLTFGKDHGRPYCKLMGTVPHGISLRVISHHEVGPGVQDSAALRYEYRALGRCSAVPRGCEPFARREANMAVLSWSRALQMQYKSPAKAWSEESKKVVVAPQGIPWHEWTVVWHFAPTWQLAFRFLDSDSNYFISPMEFAFGFNLAPADVRTPAPVPVPVPARVPSPARVPTSTARPILTTTTIPAGLSDRCPAGYYRSSAMLFGCSAGRGVVRFSMRPSSMDEAVVIPKGVKHLQIMVSANVDVDMYLWDDEASKYIVHWKEGVVNDKRRMAVYKGTTYAFSGDDRTTPILESCNLTGVLQAPVGLRLYNYAKDRATATLYYAYAGLSPCHTVPAGCEVYDRVEAEVAAMLWSKQVRRRHGSAEEAWNFVNAGKSSALGITWHDWVSHWDDEEKWKMVFRFLDIDGNSHISITEFTKGYKLAEDGTGGLVMPSTTARPVRTTEEPIVIDFPRTRTPGTCFDGQYRVDPAVFHCSGRTNLLHWTVAGKSVSEVQQLPIGLTDLSITLNAEDDVDLYLWDEAANRYILHWRDGVVNDQKRSADYQGVEVSFSGDDKRPPIQERYIFKGRLPVPTLLRLENFGRVAVELTLEYSYRKLDPCPAMPVGCAGFDVPKAEQAVMTWSQAENIRHPDANQAWAAHPHSSIHGLTWHNWRTTAALSPDWKMTFRYLDTDNDGYIGKEEFITGYRFSDKLRQRPPTGPAPPVAAPVAPPPLVPEVAGLGGARSTRRSTRPACPAGYYQSAPVVFACHGGTGSLDLATAPGKVREVMYIPRGVHDVLLQLTADVDVDLYVWDATTSSYVVHWEEGVVSEKVRGGKYHELSVTFSGDDRTPPISESVKLEGTISRTISVRLHNRAKEEAFSNLHYTYGGLSPCPTVPEGCEHYDAAVARRVAAICARQLHTYHFSAEGAWNGLVGARAGGSCVPRQNWKAACSHVDLAQMAFRYLDKDDDGCLSKEEFDLGFHTVSSGLSVRPEQKLKVAFALPNLDHKKLDAEPEVKRHLQDAVRLAAVSSCNDAAISAGNVNVHFHAGIPGTSPVEAIITPPTGKSAKSLQKYCCSPAWLNSNMRRHIANVKRVHRVFVGRITNFHVKCEVESTLLEAGAQRPIMYKGIGPVDIGVAEMLLGAMIFTGFLVGQVSLRSSDARLHAWSLINTATDIFAAALVFAAVSEFVKSLIAFTPLPVHIVVDYGLFLCAFIMLQVSAALLSLGFASGGLARGGAAAASVPIDEQVWVIADAGRADCDDKIHSHEVRTKTLARSVASLEGNEVFVKKAWHERDQEIRRIRRYTGYISYLAGFAAMHAGCALQRLIIETYRSPSAVLIPVLLNQVLLYGLFRVGQLLRSSWRLKPLLSSDSLDNLLRDPRREALLDEEILSAESDIASLACSFLLVQALHFWIAGVVPGLDRVDEELMRPLSSGRVLIFVAVGMGLALMSITLAHLTIRHQLVAWKRRLSRVWVNTIAMSSAWCMFWAAQWQLHRENSLALPATIGELAAQLLLAAVITFFAFMLLCTIGIAQAVSGPDKMLGVVRSTTLTLAVLVGASWRLAFGAAAEAAAEDTPQPAVTRLLYCATAALLVLPAANRQVLAKVMRYRQMQADLLEARGEGSLASALAPNSVLASEGRLQRQSSTGAGDDSNVWRFYRRQDDEWQSLNSSSGLQSQAKHQVQVTIMHAKGLRNADWMPFSGKSDPYCTCEIPGKSSSKVSTFVVNDDLNPVWNYTADIAEYSTGDPLAFTVYDSDMTGQDLLGRATLLASQFYPGGFEGDLPLVDAGKAANPTLTVRVKVIAPLQLLNGGGLTPSSSQVQLAAMSPMRSGGWYAEPSGKDIRPLG